MDILRLFSTPVTSSDMARVSVRQSPSNLVLVMNLSFSQARALTWFNAGSTSSYDVVLEIKNEPDLSL